MVTPDINITTLSSYNQTGIEPLVTNKDNQYAGDDSTTLTLRLAETEEYAEGIITLTITGINAEYLTKEINQRINKIPW